MTWLGRITCGFVGAMLAFYLLIVLWSLPVISADADGLAPFDLRPFGYDLDAARAFLVALGEAGLAQYLGPQAVLDRVFPALLGVTLVLCFWQLFPRRWAIGLGALALAGMWLDWQENIAVADLLKLGADGIDEEVVSIAALFTTLKSAAVTVALCALLFGVVRAVWQRRGSVE